MRSAEQISRTVREHHDAQKAERERTLAALLAELKRAREQRVEWYRWIAEVLPALRRAEWKASQQQHAPGRARARRGASA